MGDFKKYFQNGKASCSPGVLSDFCWRLKRDVPESRYFVKIMKMYCTVNNICINVGDFFIYQEEEEVHVAAKYFFINILSLSVAILYFKFEISFCVTKKLEFCGIIIFTLQMIRHSEMRKFFKTTCYSI